MLLARITKDSADVRRLTIDFAGDPAGSWLDPGEQIASISTPVIVVEQFATFQNGAFTQVPPMPPVDTTPLTLVSSAIVTSPCANAPTNAQVRLLLGVGTPGLTYKVTFVAAGSSSGRYKQVDILVSVREPI